MCKKILQYCGAVDAEQLIGNMQRTGQRHNEAMPRPSHSVYSRNDLHRTYTVLGGFDKLSRRALC